MYKWVFKLKEKKLSRRSDCVAEAESAFRASMQIELMLINSREEEMMSNTVVNAFAVFSALKCCKD